MNPETGVVAHKREVKHALKRSNLSGSFVIGKYGLSPYMACEHGCAYCDGRAERYYVEGEFDTDIVVRTNLPELLAAELPKLREKGLITIGSGITDSYQPMEARTGLMARCSEVIARHSMPASVMTKSSLIVRDLATWSRVNERSRFMLLVSLVHSDDETRRAYEPGASSVADRLETIRRFREAGCATGVLAMPLLPGITDSPDSVSRLYDLVIDAGVDFIMPGQLTLRPGRQKEFFIARLSRHHPELLPLYDDLYRENRTSGSPVNSYCMELQKRCIALNVAKGVPFLAPHSLYRSLLHCYDEINVLMQHMVELYSARDVDTRPLRAAQKRYITWLTTRKAEYNRHRSWRYEDLDEELVTLCEEKDGRELSSLLGNAKLAEFLRRIVLGRETFDYLTLQAAPA
jgi:DNA repair photolyase